MFFIIFFSLYTLLNTYVFIRGWQSLSLYPQFRIVYSVLFVIAATSYILAKVFNDYLPQSIYTLLIWIGSFWFMFLFYFFLSFVLIDLILIIGKSLKILPSILYHDQNKTKFYTGVIVLIITITAAIFGYINRLNIELKELHINLNEFPKKEYRIIFFSDLHISVINNHSFLKSIVEKINSLRPDLILIGGDLVDEKSQKLRTLKLANELKYLKTRFGIYSVAGNHEYINGADSTINYLEELGIKFLRDDVILIDSSFYVIGREDHSKFYFTKKKRESLENLINRTNKSFPKILLDHQPLNLNEAVDNHIDLQLSGHTHHGQIAPANLITKIVYELSWGFKKKGNTYIYVSSGIGTWGPPVKLGNDAELILINFKF